MARSRQRTIAMLAMILTMGASFTVPAYAADKDCGDFDTQSQAQNFFEDAGSGDSHRLDATASA